VSHTHIVFCDHGIVALMNYKGYINRPVLRCTFSPSVTEPMWLIVLDMGEQGGSKIFEGPECNKTVAKAIYWWRYYATEVLYRRGLLPAELSWISIIGNEPIASAGIWRIDESHYLPNKYSDKELVGGVPKRQPLPEGAMPWHRVTYDWSWNYVDGQWVKK